MLDHLSRGHGPGYFLEDYAFCKVCGEEEEIRGWNPISANRIIIIGLSIYILSFISGFYYRKCNLFGVLKGYAV
jgi:hypothetical protein